MSTIGMASFREQRDERQQEARKEQPVAKPREQLTAQERKEHPIYSGVLRYFPDALLEVAHLSKVGNDQHNPGQPLHWAKEKSTDEGDALVRHQLDAGTRDTDGERHSAKVAWRALAQLQREIEAERQTQGPEPVDAVSKTTYDPKMGFVHWNDGEGSDPYYEH